MLVYLSPYSLYFSSFFFQCYGDHRDLHSFPTRRSSDLDTSIKDFEAAIAELDAIVKKLEEGDLPLEQSLALYERGIHLDRKSTRLNSSHANISYAVFCLKKKKQHKTRAHTKSRSTQ